MEYVSNKTLEKLKYDLVRDGFIKYEELENAQEIANAQNINIAQALINSNLISEERLLAFLENKLHIPYVNLKDYELDERYLNLISAQDAIKYKLIPLFKIENVLTIAMADPLDLFAIDKIVENTGVEIEPVLAQEHLILKKIEEYYKDETASQNMMIDSNSDTYSWQEELHKEALSEEHIQTIIKAILRQAISQNVHELFFEESEGHLNVNFRIEAQVVPTGEIPNFLAIQFISELKSISGLDPNVSELPQLGKLVFKVDEIPLISSVSAFPTINGERILLKIYKPPKTLQEIGFSNTQIESLRLATNKPGIILVCGSALRGKTHVIYSILSNIANKNKNIFTIESISKYNLENVYQCELNENIGFNLEKAMKFIEFQSPDIIYFEELTTKEGLDYFSSLVFKDKTLITEFLADNMADLSKKLSYDDFQLFKSLITCLIFIHSSDRIEVLDKDDLKRFLP